MLTLTDNDVTKLREHRFTLAEIVEGFGIDIWDHERPFPIFDEAYRETLQNRIYDHFAFRRIAASTPQMFVFMLNRRMREQMPVFNEIYKKLAEPDFDPFLTQIGSSTGSSQSQADSKSDSTSTNKTDTTGTTITSNTPASFLQNAEDPKYMSSLVKTDSVVDATGTAASTGTNTTGGTHTDSYKGRHGYLATAVNETLVSGFVNTDAMICDMLEPLFVQFWDDQPL